MVQLFHLDFADYIAALSDSTQGLQPVMDSISDASARLGLMISRKKTKIMLSGDHQTTPDILIGQDKVDLVDDFTYLPSYINSQGSMGHEISCRIGKASAAFNQLNKIWTSKSSLFKPSFVSTIPMCFLLYSMAAKLGT